MNTKLYVTIALLVLIVLIVIFNCTISCGKEGFLSQFGDEIEDPFAYDYANYPSVRNPANIRWSATKEQIPLDESTHKYPYTGLSGNIFRPKWDQGY